MRLKSYACRTQQAYVGWIKRYIYFHRVRHPSEMGDPEVEAFLTHLAIKENVAASTHNQALSALLFLYREVLPRLHYVYRALPLQRGRNRQCCRQEQHADHHRHKNNPPLAHAHFASHAPIIPAFTSTVEHNRQNPITLTGRLVLPDIRRGQRASQERRH